MEIQINEWKNKYGSVYAITIPGNTDDGEKDSFTGYFRKPNLKIISASSRFANDNPVKSGEILFENCWLGGDQEIKDNDELKLTAITKINELFKVREADIKKL